MPKLYNEKVIRFGFLGGLVKLANVPVQSIFLLLFWPGFVFGLDTESSGANTNSKRLTPVHQVSSAISYDEMATQSGLSFEVGPYQWQRVTKADQRRRWRVSLSASHPIQLFLLDPRLNVGNPPNKEKTNSWAQRKWIQVEEIINDKFLPFGNEAASGGDWNIFIYNPSKTEVKIKLFVDTSGKPTAEERRMQPFFFLLIILLMVGSSFLMHKLIKWRRANPTQYDGWT